MQVIRNLIQEKLITLRFSYIINIPNISYYIQWLSRDPFNILFCDHSALYIQYDICYKQKWLTDLLPRFRILQGRYALAPSCAVMLAGDEGWNEGGPTPWYDLLLHLKNDSLSLGLKADVFPKPLSFFCSLFSPCLSLSPIAFLIFGKNKSSSFSPLRFPCRWLLLSVYLLPELFSPLLLNRFFLFCRPKPLPPLPLAPPPPLPTLDEESNRKALSSLTILWCLARSFLAYLCPLASYVETALSKCWAWQLSLSELSKLLSALLLPCFPPSKTKKNWLFNT